MFELPRSFENVSHPASHKKKPFAYDYAIEIQRQTETYNILTMYLAIFRIHSQVRCLSIKLALSVSLKLKRSKKNGNKFIFEQQLQATKKKRPIFFFCFVRFFFHHLNLFLFALK